MIMIMIIYDNFSACTILQAGLIECGINSSVLIIIYHFKVLFSLHLLVSLSIAWDTSDSRASVYATHTDVSLMYGTMVVFFASRICGIHLQLHGTYIIFIMFIILKGVFRFVMEKGSFGDKSHGKGVFW